MQVKKIDCNNSLPVPIMFSYPQAGLYISSQEVTNTDLCQASSRKYVVVYTYHT
jgi:hypothetical protein